MKRIFLLILILISARNFSQNFVWAKSIGGMLSDRGHSIATDLSGNVYTAGRFDIAADFDPNSPTYYLGSPGLTSAFVSKLDSGGNFVWAKQMGGLFATAQAIAVDDSGYVYTTGWFGYSGDFDPGSGTYSLSTTGAVDYDVFVSKLDKDGNFVWAKSIGGINWDQAYTLALDKVGHVYIAGSFRGTADFDPGLSVYTLTSSSIFNPDIFVVKLDTSGNFVWAKSMGGFGDEEAKSIAVDLLGNVYTTGYFQSADSDFDPSPSSYTITTTGLQDIFVSKLDSLGNFVWAKKMGGIGDDMGNGIALDELGNVFLTGFFNEPADFDPGVGNYTLSAASAARDAFITKLDSFGNFVWAKAMGGIGDDIGFSIVIDGSSNIHTTGKSTGYNISVSKLDPLGNIVSNQYISTGGYGSTGNGITLDPSENIYITGYFYGPADLPNDPNIGSTLVSEGSDDIIIAKLSCSLPDSALLILGLNNVCNNSSTSYSIIPSANTSGYSFSLPLTSSLNTSYNPNLINVTFGSSSGNIIVTPTNACGIGISTSFSVTLGLPPSIVSQPINQTLTVGANAQFSVSSSDQSSTFQWQVYSVSGFINLTNSAQYSGVSTNTLTVNNVLLAQNNYSFRCIASNNYCSDTSNIGKLDVYSLNVNSINKLEREYRFIIYPNPSNDIITVLLTINTFSNLIYDITDQMGRQALKGVLTNKNSNIDISHLAAGFYFFNIEGISQKPIKLVKQ